MNRSYKDKIRKLRISEGRYSELSAQNDSRKSFYGKAHVVTDDDGTQILYSYDTPVVEIRDGKVKLLAQWDSSQTTLRHVKEFLKQNGFEATSKGQIAKTYGRSVESISRKSKKSRIRERMLNEGPGAGYTIKSKGLSDVVIDYAKVAQPLPYGDAIVNVSGTATVDEFYADSYYYGTGEISDVKVSISRVYVPYSFIEYYGDDIEELDAETLAIAVGDVLAEYPDSKVNYGGGWSHTPYDGTIGSTDDDGYWSGRVTDDSVIHYVDEAVTGENTYSYYRIIIDGYDIYDTVDTEDEAIKIADELALDPEYDGYDISVEKVSQFVDYNGESDYNNEWEETVYTVDR